MRLSLAGTLTLSLLAGVSGAVIAQTTEPPSAVSVTKDLRYTEGEPELDVYARSGPGPLPVVVLVHGSGQHRDAFGPLAEAIAMDGAVVYNVDWSYHPVIPDATDRIACAVRFARATAAGHGGDATRITLVGHSAGAAMGMVVALAGDEYGEYCLVPEAPALVDVLVGYEGPYAWATPGMKEPLPRDADPASWRAIDPYAHIGKNLDLVVRLVHGDAEDLSYYDTPLDWSIELDEALQGAGYDTELTVVPGAGHSTIMEGDSGVADVILQKLRESAAPPAE